jgi:hypothetical protein
MAESAIVRTKRDIQIAYTDGTNTYTVAYEPGDFNLDIPLETVNNFLDRGVMPTTPSIRLGDDQPMTFSHTAYERDWLSAADHATLLDIAVIFTSKYVASNWTSTIGTASDATTWGVNLTQEGSDFGESDISLQLPYSVVRASRADGDPNVVSITGTSFRLRPTVL